MEGENDEDASRGPPDEGAPAPPPPPPKKKPWDLDERETCELLKSLGVKQSAAEALFQADLSGSMFWEFGQEEYLDMARADPENLGQHLKVATIVSIVKLRDKLLEKESKDVQESSANQSTVLERRKGPIRQENLRKFGHPVDSELQYTRGNTTGTESGGRPLLRPAIEFKKFDISSMSGERAVEEAFVKRVGKFALGCMNKRCNGVLYLGVAERKTKTRGEGSIVGVQLSDQYGMSLFQKLTDLHFRGRCPKSLDGVEAEIQDAVANCLRGPWFVPVTKGTDTPDLFVIEVEVEPAEAICKELRFYWYMRLQDEQGSSKKKKKTKKNLAGSDNDDDNGRVRIYYLREGEETNSYQYKNELKEFSRKVNEAIRVRHDEEKKYNVRQEDSIKRLWGLLCRGRASYSLNDRDHNYVLIYNGLPDLEEASWMEKIDWHMVLDFSSAEGTSDLYRHMTKSKLRTPSLCQGRKLTELLDEVNDLDAEFLEDLEIGTRTIFVQCGSQDFSKISTWNSEVMEGLRALIPHMIGPPRQESSDTVVVMLVLGSENGLNEITLVMRKMAEKVKPDQFVCILEDGARIDAIDREAEIATSSDNWERHKIRVRWPQLHEFLNRKTEKTLPSGYHLPASVGDMVSVPTDYLNTFEREGIVILPSNQCDEKSNLSMEDTVKRCEEGREKILQFLRGNQPDWPVFFYADIQSAPIVKEMPPGLVEREITPDIIYALDLLANNDEKCVGRVRLSHYPGSGATTIGKTILWKKRCKMRCLMLNGQNYLSGEEIMMSKLNKTADKVLTLRAFKEDEGVWKGKSEEFSCPTVLIFFDNCSDDMARLLTKKLESNVERRGIHFKKTMFLLLYTVLEINSDQYLVKASEGTNKFHIQQTLEHHEKKTFKSRLDYLVQSSSVEPHNMLAFVIMAEDFDNNSEYVRKLVKKALENMEVIYKEEHKLLLYLSIIKCFGNEHLPLGSCLRLAFPLVIEGNAVRLPSWWKKLSPQTQMFVTSSKREANDSTYVASYEALEISHVPIAYQLFLELGQGRKLDIIVKEMLKEEVLIRTPFLKDLTHGILRKLLVRRDFFGTVGFFHDTSRQQQQDEGRQGRKPKFSNLIEYVIGPKDLEGRGRDDASELLESAFIALPGDEDKAYIAQAIARLHYDDKKKIDKAKKWAMEASSLAPNKFAIADTEGQVYKRHLKFLIEDQRNPNYYMKDCQALLEAGASASKYFKRAQRLFVAMKKKMAKEDGKKTIVVATADQDASSDNPGLFGEIDSNLMLAGHILGTKDLDRKKKKQVFLQLLRGERYDIDLPALFEGDIPWLNGDHVDFIKHLFTRTDECLHNATRKLSYTTAQLINNESNRWRMEALEKFSSRFRDLFCVETEADWRRIVKARTPAPKKMALLRKHLYAGIANSFGWIRFRPINVLRGHMDVLAEMVACDEALLWKGDKIAYANVFFAFVYNRKEEECRQLKVDRIKDFCRQLVVQEKVDFPEPYFFFLMLFWPRMEEVLPKHSEARRDIVQYKTADSEILETLRKCIEELPKFEEQLADAQIRAGLRWVGHNHAHKPCPIFYLREESTFGSLPLSPATGHRAQWKGSRRMSGTLDRNENVVITFAPDRSRGVAEERLTVRAATHFTRGKGWIKDVSFVLGFTFSGPVAYDIKQENVENRILEMLGIPTGANDQEEGAEEKDGGEQA